MPKPRTKTPARTSFVIGEIYLVAMPDLGEFEIEQVSAPADAVKIKGRGWMQASALAQKVKARLGRAVYSSGLFGHTRRFIRET